VTAGPVRAGDFAEPTDTIVFMHRIRNSIQLARESWRILRADRELIVLPIVSGTASTIVAASFVVPLFVAGAFDGPGEGGVVFYGVLFVMYVALAYVTIFFNAALVSAAHERLSGGDPTLRSALAGARSNAGRILPWAIVSATVSLILRAIEERAGFLGRLAAGLAGVAWAVVTFLVLPVIVIERVGVRDAVKTSGNLFRRTWGENIAAQVGFGLVGFLSAAMAVFVVVLSLFTNTGWVILPVMALAFLWILGTSAVLAAMNGIFQTALYHYAVDGRLPDGTFSESTMQAAFAPKRGARRGGIPGFGGGFAG
jgi:hypothetical protein